MTWLSRLEVNDKGSGGGSGILFSPF
jgi:hypothetical protein